MKPNVTRAILITLALGAAAMSDVEALAQAARNPGYQWTAELVSYDAKARTMTVKAVYQEHINRYIGEFKPGDKVLVTWSTPNPGQTEAINYVGRYEGSGSNWGYVLPVEFVSGDTVARRLTFTVAIEPKAVSTLKSVAPGQPITVMTPFDQPKDIAVGVVVQKSAGPIKQQS